MWTFYYKFNNFGANTLIIVLFYLILYNAVIIEGQRNAKRKQKLLFRRRKSFKLSHCMAIFGHSYKLKIRNILFHFSGTKRKGGKCKRMCNVMESGSKTMKECKFPFIFKGQTFESCTDYKVIQ